MAVINRFYKTWCRWASQSEAAPDSPPLARNTGRGEAPSPELFATLFHAVPDAMIIVDAEGVIRHSNPHAEALFGYSATELAGMSFEALIPERLRAQQRTQARLYFRAPVRRPMGPGEDLFCLTRAGREIPVDISLSPISGKPLQVLVTLRDVSERRQQAEELHAAKARAEQASLAKTRFLAAASHDLRQQLQSLSMYLGVLSGVTNTSKQAQIVTRMQLSLNSIGNLLNSLLDISKLEAGAIKPEISDFPIRQVLRRVYATVLPQAQDKGIRLRLVDSSAWVRTDPVLLEQILTNLAGNAVRYTPQGGVLIGCRRGKQLRVEVCDTGLGIPAEAMAVIFDEFVQLHHHRPQRGSPPGMGLGLAIVKRVADLLRLRVEANSSYGAGSKFAVYIPLGTPAESATPESGATTKRAARVLLLEDDDAVLDSTTIFLRASGYEVLAEPSGEQALATLEALCTSHELKGAARTDALPDLIISDYRLAGDMSGLQAITAIRRRLRRELPAILISGDTSSQLIAVAERVACRRLCKPVEAGVLIKTIEYLLASG